VRENRTPGSVRGRPGQPGVLPRYDGVDVWDFLGNDPYYEEDVKCAVILEIGHRDRLQDRVKTWNAKRKAYEETEPNYRKYPAQMSGIACAVPALGDKITPEGFENKSPYDSIYPIPGIPVNRGFLGAIEEKRKMSEPAQNGGLNPVKNPSDPWDYYNQVHGYLDYIRGSWDAALTSGLLLAGSNYTYAGDGKFKYDDNCRCDNIVVKFTFEDERVRENFSKYALAYRGEVSNYSFSNGRKNTMFYKYNITPFDLNNTKIVAGQQVQVIPTTNQRVVIPRGGDPGIATHVRKN